MTTEHDKYIDSLINRIEELKQECERQHANTADQFDRAERFDAALARIERISPDYTGACADIARKARNRKPF